MFEKLETVQVRLEEILREMSSPEIQKDSGKLRELMKEQSEIQPIADTYAEYKKAVQDEKEGRELLESEEDPEMRQLSLIHI